MANKKREIKKSFNELPEHIIQHILSFLPEKDATKTTIFCKSWLSAWRTKPNLEFNTMLFFDKELKIQNKGPGSIWDLEREMRRKKFYNYVERTLKRYTEQKMSIETLDFDARLFENYSPQDSVAVQRCTQVAVERGVKKLHIFGGGELPQVIVGAKSLVDLSIGKHNMLHLSTEKIMWRSLKRLCLYFLYFDEVVFDNIISSCPLLEIFEISFETGYVDDQFEDLHDQFGNELGYKVIEHHNLKQLSVKLIPRKRLILGETPKLESLVCTYHEDYLDHGEWIPCGFSLHSSQYHNLKMLHLWAVSINDDFFNNFQHKFPHLQDLLVLSCQFLKRIQISSQTLQRIQLVQNSELEEAHFDVPSIERLDYICDDCEIIPELSFTPTKGKAHWISKLRINWRGNVDSSWFLQLKKLLFNLIPSEIFLVLAICGRIELDINEIRNSVTFSEPQELQELSLFFYFFYSSSILLDCLFWICRPKSISQCWVNGSGDEKFLKLFLDMVMFKTNQDHHQKLQQSKSWQNDLRQVKVQIYDCGVLCIGKKNDYFRGKLAHQQPEALDWESIMKALRNNHGNTKRKIYFMLDWEKNSMSKGKKSYVPKESKRIKQNLIRILKA